MGGKHLCVGREKADNSYFDANTLETPLRRQRKVAASTGAEFEPEKHLCVGREKDSEGAIALVNLETPLRRQRKGGGARLLCE